MKFELEKLLTVKDIEKAKELIGKKVFACDDLNILKKNIEENKTTTLIDVDYKDVDYPYRVYYTPTQCQYFRYCYPYEEEQVQFEDAQKLLGKIVVQKEASYFNEKDRLCKIITEVRIAEGICFVNGKKIDSFLESYTYLDGSEIKVGE